MTVLEFFGAFALGVVSTFAFLVTFGPFGFVRMYELEDDIGEDLE